MRHALCDCVGCTCAFNDDGVVFVNFDALCATKHVDVGRFEVKSKVLGDYLSACQDCDILKHSLSSVAESGCLYRNACEAAAQFVEDKSGEGFAFDVFGDDQQFTARLDNLFEKRQNFLNGTDLLVCDKDKRIVQFGNHFVGVSHHVGACIAAVELHTLDDVQFRLHGFAFFYGNYAVVADLFHSRADKFADGVVACGNACNLCDCLCALYGRADCFEFVYANFDSFVDTFTQNDGVCAGCKVFVAFYDNCLRKYSRRGGAVAYNVVRFGAGFLDYLRAHVFKRVFEFDFLGNGHAVVDYHG